MPSYKYGIDFGTTNSSIAIVQNNYLHKGPRALEIDHYDMPYELLRSVVGYKDNVVYVGNEGLEQLVGSDDNPIRQVKLSLLSEERDSCILTIDGEKLFISDVVAEILRRLKTEADKQVHGITVSGVVMGVPYHTSEAAKNVYLRSLVKAKYFIDEKEARDKTEFVEEPVAVALYYGMQTSFQHMRSLVFDFGGGTLDIAVVDLKKQSYNGGKGTTPHKVLAKGGYHGAGENFTKLLFTKVFYPKYKEKYCGGSPREFAKAFLNFNLRASSIEQIWMYLEGSGLGWQFINALDKAKVALSEQKEYEFRFDVDANSEHGAIHFLPIVLSRDEFETAISPELEHIEAEVQRTIQEASRQIPGLCKTNIDNVLMAGGSSLIPAVRKCLEKSFGHNKVFLDSEQKGGYNINVMTCIALGLAVQGFQNGNQLKVLDVTSHSYGILDGSTHQLVTIIPPNTPIDETRVNKVTLEGKYHLAIENVNRDCPHFQVEIYEDNHNILELIFNKEDHSGDYDIFFEIDPKRQVLEVFVYDTNACKWLEDVPAGERSYEITK